MCKHAAPRWQLPSTGQLAACCPAYPSLDKRTDPSSAVTPCSNEPSGYYFISFGNPFYDSKANMSSPQPQSPSMVYFFCTNEGSSGTPTCQTPSTNSFQDTVTYQNTQTLKEGGSVTVGGPLSQFLGGLNMDIPGSISLNISDSTAHTLTQSGSGTGGISPQLSPGQCALVTVNLNPSLTTSTLGYYVPITGGISAWYMDSVSVPTMMSMGRHFDWNLYVEDLEPYVHDDHFTTQNGQLCFHSSISVTALSYNGQAQVMDADCTTRQPLQGAAAQATTLAALRSSQQSQGG
ncbi:hypothetical protein COCOBI_08-5160 [Coccomyxa sp. Obi]|nr:hypothetical protein COCOBI_08-5160 [Coccomyxa sp. Obi]